MADQEKRIALVTGGTAGLGEDIALSLQRQGFTVAVCGRRQDKLGAMDLDQALHIARTPTGFRVSYAIADVAAFVTPGDPVDLEANRRGETLYGADSKIPLHPEVLSEDPFTSGGVATWTVSQLAPTGGDPQVLAALGA